MAYTTAAMSPTSATVNYSIASEAPLSPARDRKRHIAGSYNSASSYDVQSPPAYSESGGSWL